MFEKDKSSTYSSRTTKRMQFSRGPIAFITALFFIALTVYYLKSSEVSPMLSKDRSEAYNVKVLPADLDDAGLAALPKDSFSYLAMIDAGSSGCRAHVFRYGKLGSVDGPLYVLPQHDSKKVKPGLSSFATHPDDAGASLVGLVDFIKEQVPQAYWGDTPIWLKATAGLRMLEVTKSEAILQSVRKFLIDSEKSPFLFRDSFARIISGNEEGGFGWIAFNYLKKVIGPKKIPLAQPYAVVEMGGASSQVSQLAPTKDDADKIPSEHRFSFTVEGETYHLYTHSYLGFGGEQGREALNAHLSEKLPKGGPVEDPCLNKGYTRNGAEAPRKEVYEGLDAKIVVQGAATNTGNCINTVKEIFFESKCDPKSGPFSFGCVHQPKFVTDSPNFLVFENFFYVSSAVGVLPADHEATAAPPAKAVSFPLVTTPDEYAAAASAVCGVDWSTVQSSYPVDSQGKENNIKWCFMTSYASAFLTRGLGLRPDKKVTVQKEVDGSEIEWALGAAYKEAALLLKRTNLRPQ